MSCIVLLRSIHSRSFQVRTFGLLKRVFLPVLSSRNSFCANPPNPQGKIPDIQPPSNKEVLYKYKRIKHLAFISRVKIFHVLIVSGLTVPMCVWYTNGLIEGKILLATVISASATTAGLFALSYFFRRIIGELSYDKENDKVTISTLTFWGKRQNTEIPLASLVPMCDNEFDKTNLFHRLERYGSDFVYLLNLRHGKIYNYNKLLEVLGIEYVVVTTQVGQPDKTAKDKERSKTADV